VSASQANNSNSNTDNSGDHAIDPRLSGATNTGLSGSTVASAGYTADNPQATSYNSDNERVPNPGPLTITSTDLRRTLPTETVRQPVPSSLDQRVEGSTTSEDATKPMNFGAGTRGGLHSGPSHKRDFSGSSAGYSNGSASPLQFEMESTPEPEQ
jgi:hypothetical protein